jgi:hypothetical protein
MARICGVCLRPPREGEEMRPIRLAEDDLGGKAMAVGETGLYQACEECVENHRERLAEKRALPVEAISNNALC